MKTEKNMVRLIGAFLRERLISQKRVSHHTVMSYSTTFQLLLKFTASILKKSASGLCLDDFNDKLISKFLDDLEKRRRICVRSRNLRLTAIHSFFKYISTEVPEEGVLINRVLAIPPKRSIQKTVTFLSNVEVKALLSAPDQKTWLGRRDHVLLALAIHTGFRVSELCQLSIDDVIWGQKMSISCIGKGRKQRSIPLSREVGAYLRNWAKELGQIEILFPTVHGKKMSSDSVQYLLQKYVVIAAKGCLSLKDKKVTPHMLRHTTAMRLLQSGADQASIAIWLGHESIKTTYIYFTADMKMKEHILEKLPTLKTKNVRFKTKKREIDFLKELSSSERQEWMEDEGKT
jgi:integrase/recombinase XerD